METLIKLLLIGAVGLILMATVMFGIFLYDEIKERFS
jgi:hypothetical protein